MSPTVRHDPATVDLDAVHHARTPRVAASYACALLVVALGIVGVLAVNGQPWPSPGPLLLLAIPLALCMNRFVFFPNEIGVTADAAVIFAAMVAFQHDAQWLGPLVVALLAGPLDAKHWGERAFVRMAYNSGSTALVTCIGLVVFDALSGAFGSGWFAPIGAAAIAAIPYVAAESVCGVVLVALLGERPRAALRHQLPLNAIALPLAIFGAAAGLAAVDLAWWVTFLLLLPVPLVPEFLIVVLPRRLGARRGLATLLLAASGGLLVASLMLPGSTAPAIAGILAVSCMAIAESPPEGPRRALPLAAVLVVVPIAAFPDVWIPAMTVPMGAVLVAASCGAFVVAIAGSPVRRGAWALPFVGVAACLARVWGMADRPGALVFATGMSLVLFVAAAWGPLPWSSCLVGPAAQRCSNRARQLALVALVIASMIGALGALVTTGTDRSASALAATALLETTVAAAALSVRLWRFVKRRRVIEIVTLAFVGVLALTVYLPLALDGSLLAVPVAIAVLAVSTSICVSTRAVRPSLSGIR